MAQAPEHPRQHQVPPYLDAVGHHSGAGRNVAAEGGGLGGKDIFFAAVQMTRMPMCLADPTVPDLPLVFVNEAFQRMTGYQEHEILGRNCRFLQGPQTDPAAIAQIRQAIATEEDLAVELLNYKRDGTPFWNALYLSPVFDGQGKLIYFFASQLDVTRRREAEAVLQQSQRMEALGSMASGVAHEFNNLMTIVVGSSQQALARAVDPRQRSQLDRIEDAARHAGRLTQQMLSFARRQFHDPQPADINVLLSGMDELVRHVAGGEVEVTMNLSPVPLPVRVDAGQLELALVNLVRNASDAMPQGGKLTLSTAALEVYGEAPRMTMTIADTGEGMTADVLRQATDPFFTTKGSGKGTGLGLSMVAGFVEQSGGTMQIDSTPGAGARITLLLPCDTSRPSTSAQGATPSRPAAEG